MDQKRFGKQLAVLRKAKGLTQEELGDRLGVTNKTVSRWENGNYLPDVETLGRLGRALGVPLSTLLEGTAPPAAPVQERQNFRIPKDEPFSVEEQKAYWKKKWLREHSVLLTVVVVVLLTLLVLAIGGHPMLSTTWCAACFWTYLFLRNRMMIYVDHKLYDD